jgi:hypothetical protein
LTFTSANWNVVQTVTLTGVDDDQIDILGDSDYACSLSISSSTQSFWSVDDPTVTNTDCKLYSLNRCCCFPYCTSII